MSEPLAATPEPAEPLDALVPQGIMQRKRWVTHVDNVRE